MIQTLKNGKIVVYTTCDKWENFGHIKTSSGRCKIVDYTTCDQSENFIKINIKTSFGRRKIVVYMAGDEWESFGHKKTSV